MITYILDSFAVILSVIFAVNHHEAFEPPLAPSTTTDTSASTSLAEEYRARGAIDQEATESSQDFVGTSHCRPTPTIGGKNGHNTLVLRNMPEKEFLPSRVLRSMWCLLGLGITWIYRLGTRSMARSTKDTEEAKSTTLQKQRTWEWKQQRKGKRQIKSRRISRTVILYTLAIFVVGLAILGGDFARDESKSSLGSTTETSGGSNQWLACSPQKPWTRGQSGGGILLGQMLGDWATGYKASLSTSGSLRENGGQAEGRVGSACGGLAEVPKEGGRRVPIPKAEIPGQAEATSRRSKQGRRGIHGRTGSPSRSCHFGRYSTRRSSNDPTQAPRINRRAKDGWDWDSKQAQTRGGRGGRCRPSYEKAEISHPHCGLAYRKRCHGQDGFLIGRQDSCHNNDLARRPRFFCLAEYLEVDVDSHPSQVGTIGAVWTNLRPPCMAQPIREGTPYPTSTGTYGPRQAEYIAQLMKYGVETDSCHEAFDHCLWDETMNDLWHVDQIETSYWSALKQGLSPPCDVVRQIEGCTLWPLLAMQPGDDQPGGIEWNGAPFQGGPLSSLSEGDLSLFVESMQGDCTYAFEVLAHSLPHLPTELTLHSYGYFGRYRGVRTIQIPIERLNQWHTSVKQQWSDFEPADSINLHVALPQPVDSTYEIHVVARTRHSRDGHRFILVDKIEESPQVESNRRVIETSPDPNGYEILLASEININVVTSRTILKHGNVVWQHHRHPPIQDGQYWRILMEETHDESNMLQQHYTIGTRDEKSSISQDKHSQYPHVSDRWCDIESASLEDQISDSAVLMQLSTQETPSEGAGLDFEIPSSAWNNFCEVCFFSPEEGSWTLMTYGLLGCHIGFRPVEINEVDPHSVKEAVRAAWDDIPHSGRLHVVKSSLEVGPVVDVIIEFESSYPLGTSEIPILRRIFQNNKMQVEAAYHHAARYTYDLYYQAGLFSTCAPWDRHECRVFLNKAQLRESMPFVLRPGDLLDIYIDPLRDGLQNPSPSTRDDEQHPEEDEVLGLMQRPNPSQPDGPITHDFFHLENEHFHIDIATEDLPSIETVVENDRQLPTTGPSSIRGLHWVSNPPRISGGTPTVYIVELRGDAESRLMNDDVLCLCQLSIEQPGPRGDLSTRIRVLWTPHIASRERIMFHLRAADLCREMTCQLYVNHIAWNEQDSILRHFLDGDFIHLRVIIEQGGSVAATRCDFQSYESTERQRRVFTNGSSSDDTEDPEASPSDDSTRSRSRGRRPQESDDEPDPPPLSTPELQEEDEEENSLLHVRSSIRTRRTIHLQETLPSPSIIACDFTPVQQAKDVIEGIPWILTDLPSITLKGQALDAIQAYLPLWQGEPPISYHLYTDGSFHKQNPEIGGCGVLLIVSTANGPLCGGVLSRTCRPTSKAHSAETIAMLWATWVAVQLSTLHGCRYPGLPFLLEFGFDAQVTGFQCAGSWTSYQQPSLQRWCRDMVYIVQHRHGHDSITWTHIRAHQGPKASNSP